MAAVYYSKDDLARAREVDLLTYLQRCEPSELVHVGGSVYATRSHDSLKISNGKWCWWSQRIGGKTALDYLIKVRGMTLPEAVGAILGAPRIERAAAAPARTVKPSVREFRLPKRHADERRVFSYLRSRGIDAEIINCMIERGQLYEDAEHHNCVFVGYDRQGAPRYGALRGTLSQSTFVGDVGGSDKRFSFAVPVEAGESSTICVFESAIDALSYLTLLKLSGKDWRKANVLSLAGIQAAKQDGEAKFPLALDRYLKDNGGIRRVVLCLDNDEAGRAATEAIRAQLESYDAREYEVLDRPPRRGKDYNDVLQMEKGVVGRVKTRGGEAR